jgi:uncharacterized protein YndB with AHSA1/START domain
MTKTKMTIDPNRAIKFERRYQCKMAHLWHLWTTKAGFESWWGPEGFRVEVGKLDLTVGGDLIYDMIAVAPEQIEFLKKANMPASHRTVGKFVEIAAHERICINHAIDFIPGVRPYENIMRVVFVAEAEFVHMFIDVDEHVDQAWTQAATLGIESQLTKVPAALAALAPYTAFS